LVVLIARSATNQDLALLYSGLDAAAAGDVVAALDQRGTQYEVRGGAIYVASDQRDVLRMTLAADGLPANSTQGYELLDNLSGFGTTSQMFDAAYWRAKEGELARTIQSAPHIRSARVHISSQNTQSFARAAAPTAAVTVTSVAGTLTDGQARALRFLVASAVSGMSPDDVTVIDSQSGLIGQEPDSPATHAAGIAGTLKARAERLLEAHVGLGNSIVEVSVETVTETESIVEHRIDPESRVAISTEVEEKTNSEQSNSSGVTVASNLPSGNAAGGGTGSTNENAESRTLTNYEVSQTQREVVRAPGAVRRLTIAVLVNDVTTVAADGSVTRAPRSDAELAALSDLVASAVGLDTARGDIITLRSMPFEPVADLGTPAPTQPGSTLNFMSMVQIAVAAVVTLILGLFVIRPILTQPVRPAALPISRQPDPLARTEQPPEPATAIQIGSAAATKPTSDPVDRVRQMIRDRQSETLQLLQDWIDDPKEAQKS